MTDIRKTNKTKLEGLKEQLNDAVSTNWIDDLRCDLYGIISVGEFEAIEIDDLFQKFERRIKMAEARNPNKTDMLDAVRIKEGATE